MEAKKFIKATLVCFLCFIPGAIANIFASIGDDSLFYFWGGIIYNEYVNNTFDWRQFLP